ncbi:CC0125/CC1285 family lipoprotein [Sphingomonas aracearum]|uniref:DUF4136 domain-containing protein n=1 Tax=Sphingomonas aracearum TaxID=2283317 RepID=A0A369VYN6_9SPHN|nr:hypothetical protein [Sphingomonas aracearum]RDE06240.1 hypothetical protein DVW87_00430 [Sphingomonas aracearum]
MLLPSAKRGLLLAAVAAAGLVTAGCATETAYRPATGQGFYRAGYSDRQVEANRFIVSFSGNSYTSRDTVERYLLFRAAELTVQNGGDYFVMVQRDTDKDTRTYSTPGFGPSFGFGGYWGPSWRYWGRPYGWRSWDPFWGDPFWDRGVDVRTVQRYEATAEIIIGKGPKPADNVRAFDARDVMARIGPSIVVPK